MSYETIQNAVDYYLTCIDEVSRKLVVPPKLEVLTYAVDSLPTSGVWLHAAKRINFKTNNVYAIRYFVSNDAKGALGPITLNEYCALSEELETALSEYRRKNFKRVSRQQRHTDDDNTKYRNPRQTRNKV